MRRRPQRWRRHLPKRSAPRSAAMARLSCSPQLRLSPRRRNTRRRKRRKRAREDHADEDRVTKTKTPFSPPRRQRGARNQRSPHPYQALQCSSAPMRPRPPPLQRWHRRIRDTRWQAVRDTFQCHADVWAHRWARRATSSECGDVSELGKHVATANGWCCVAHAAVEMAQVAFPCAHGQCRFSVSIAS